MDDNRLMECLMREIWLSSLFSNTFPNCDLMNIVRDFDSNPIGQPLATEHQLIMILRGLIDTESITIKNGPDEELVITKRDPYAAVKYVRNGTDRFVRYASSGMATGTANEKWFAIDDDTEIPLDLCIPVDMMIQVVLDYFGTGQPSGRVKWKGLSV